MSERGFLGPLCASALIAGPIGAIGSAGLVLWAGRRNSSGMLLGLFIVWVLSPFIALLLANVISRRWSVVSRAALHVAILVYALVTLAIYGVYVLGPSSAKSAFVFIIVRLDMSRVGIFGHSFGGAQAAQFCSQDPRCKAGIDVDGRPLGSVVRAGIQKPFMFLLSDHDASEPESQQIETDIQSIYDRLPANHRLRIVIRGANHFTFNDDGALLKSQAVRGLLRILGKLGIDGHRQLAVTTYCVHRFFDAYLKEPGDSRLEISSSLYPEIQVIE